MKNNQFLFVFLLVLIIFVMAVLLTPTPTNWTFTYSGQDKNPHGSYLLYEELDQIFPEAEIEMTDSTTFQVVRNWEKDSSLLMIITDNYYNYESDVRTRLDSFVNEGNNVFISAKYITFRRSDTSQMGKHQINTVNNYFYSGYNGFDSRAGKDNLFITKLLSSTDTTSYSARGEYIKNSIQTDSTKHFKLGEFYELSEEEEDTSYINFIRVPYGKGNYYFHSNPGVFTNNAMLHDSLANYATGVLAHLPKPKHIIWDEYSKPGFYFLDQMSKKRLSPWSFIKQNPALRFAMWITILGSLLLIFTKGKREQQAIPVIKPHKNQSVEFAETMGRFYHEKGQHLDLAKKRMTYFEHDFRKKFKIQQLDEYKSRQKELAHITGIEENIIAEFYRKRELLQKVSQITEDQLQKVSRSIENMKIES